MTRIASVLLAFFLTSAACSARFELSDGEARRIEALVGETLSDLKAKKRPNKIAEINRFNAGLDRRRLTGEELVELKYLLSAFRESVVIARTNSLETVTEGELGDIIEDLGAVGGYLNGNRAKRLLGATETFTQLRVKLRVLLAKYSDLRDSLVFGEVRKSAEASLMAGPSKIPLYDGPGKVEAYDNSGWLGDKAFSLIHYKSNSRYTAIVRGIEVRSGDIYSLDQGIAAGVNTNFSIPRSIASHTGLVVFLEFEDDVYPAFFEIAERGLRVVPLNAAFAPPFTWQGEVFRPADIPSNDFPTWAKQLSADVQAQLKEKYFYAYSNPVIQTGNELGLVCSSQVQCFLLRAGVRLDLPVDVVDDRAVNSLQTQFKFPLSQYVSPTSFFRKSSSRLDFVGSVSSPFTQKNIARELVIGSAGEVAPESLGYLFSHYDLDVNKISPPELKSKYRNLQYLAPLVLASGVVSVEAPAAVLAFAKVLDVPLTSAVVALDADFSKHIYSFESDRPFSLHEVASDPKFVEVLRRQMSGLSSWFGVAEAK